MMKEYGEVLENVDLKKYNTYGIGGIARFLVLPYSVTHLQGLLEYLNSNNIPWYILGGGSNVILPDDDFAGAIISLKNIDQYEVKKDVISVGAGIRLGVMVKKMLDDGFTNYGSLMGIPGLLGGAIVGNAGAYGISIFDYLISVTVMDRNGNISILKKDDIKYDYRYTELKNNGVIVIAASFLGIKGSVVEELEKIEENMQKRKSTQPLEYKNAGSVFRNPPNFSAGYLIEHAGLKGLAIGGAKVSERHANFIINYNNAKSRDIIELIEVIKKEVKLRFNEELKLEQVIVKW